MMKKFIAALLMLSSPLLYGDYSEPYAELDKTALKKVNDFIPAQWNIIALAQGDLNKDKRTDYAIVIQSTDPNNIKSSGGLIATDIDINPRHLVILFGNKPGGDLSLVRKRLYRKFIPSLTADSEGSNQAEPLSYIAINEGALEIKFETQGAESSSWQRSHITYRFRYAATEDRFMLATYDYHNVHRATGMFKKRSIDFEKGTQESASGSMSSPKHRAEQGRYKTATHWTPCSIKQPLTFRP